MKKLLFLGIVVLMVQSLGAVTLPSTSYSPYSASTPSGESFTTTGGTMVTGSYHALGAIDPDVCTGSFPGVPSSGTSCSNCCADASGMQSCIDACSAAGGDPDKCESDCASTTGYTACVSSCNAGPSIPLDGGLGILLIFSLAGGAAKLLCNRKNA